MGRVFAALGSVVLSLSLPLGVAMAQPAVAKAPAASAPAAARPALPKDAKPVASKQGDHFRLEVLQAPLARVGQTVPAELRLLPRGGYKVNKAYPTRAELRSTLTFAKPTLKKADALELSDATARFPLDFTPSQPGPTRVELEVRFSVCNKSACDLGKETLTWTVQATR